MAKVILIGKPNSGKSSLFNQLTGFNQKIGNFPGVTVEQKKGKFQDSEIVDLPGLQSLQSTNLDELISKREIFRLTQKEGVVFVANGMQLAESLELFSQIADLQIPAIFVINFKDEIEQNKVGIDLAQLQKRLGCKVILVNAKQGDGLAELKQLIADNQFNIPNAFCRSQYDKFNGNGYTNNYRTLLENEKDISFWEKDYHRRRQIINTTAEECIAYQPDSAYLKNTHRLDHLMLHPVKGLLIFLVVMFIVFQAIFSFAEYPMAVIESGQEQLISLFDNKIIIALITGIGTVLIFIPPIAILFFLLGILEQTGYLSRISFISDAFLRKFGLSGHSVVPLMSSWACAIPAIMSARMISNPKERFAVIMASPLMTCSARLPVYAILIIVIFPRETTFWGAKGLTLLALYLLGFVATLVVAWVISKRSKIPSNDNWILELPVFRSPNWKNIFITVYQKTKSFVVQAGKIILVISILLVVLSEYSPRSEAFINQKIEESSLSRPNEKAALIEKNIALEYSYLGYIGKGIEPLIRPLGYDWKIGIALFSSFAAREVFVPTLATIYSIEEVEDEDEAQQNIRISDKLRLETDPKTHLPVFSLATSVSLLLFYVFAMQCMSTLAIVRKETNSWYYALIQFVFMLILAYVFAFAAFQLLK